LDLSMGVLVWLLAHPEATRRVTLAAHLLQACSSLALHTRVSHLLFTLALHTCSSHLLLFTCSSPAQAQTHSYIIVQQHTSVPVCCMRSVPALSQLLVRWQIISERRTTDADKCAVRLLQPFVFAYALFACGCFCRCLWLFSPIVYPIPCFPQYPICSSSVVNLLRVPHTVLSAARYTPTDLLYWACEFRVAINEQSDMTTGRKFQYLLFFCLLSLPISYL